VELGRAAAAAAAALGTEPVRYASRITP
jgi:hypothetical protein